MNKRSIATVSLSGALDEKLRAIAAAGFDAVEIFENDLLSFDGTPARRRHSSARDLGLAICAFQPFRDFEGMPEPQRARNFARAERKFDLMQELGTDLLLVCSNVSPASLGGIDRAAADFRELGERAAKRGLRVGFEALAWGRHVNDYRDAWEIVRRADHPVDRRHPRQLPRAGAGLSDSRRSARSRRTRSSWCSSPTRRSSTSTSCPGAGISAASRARAICRSPTSCRRSRRPAMPDRCRSKSSTTSSAPARPRAPRSTACAR